MIAPAYDLRPCGIGVVRELCEKYHGYGGAGRNATYAFALYEDQRIVAGFIWQPPAPGAARAIAPEEPSAVLVLLQRQARRPCTHAIWIDRRAALEAAQWLADHGWQRVAVPGAVWRSGNPAYTWQRGDQVRRSHL